jgi:hypothetical protein
MLLNPRFLPPRKLTKKCKGHFHYIQRGRENGKGLVGLKVKNHQELSVKSDMVLQCGATGACAK